MVMAITVDVTETKIIKPSSPTSPDQKFLKLSLLDQFTPATYNPLLLFYHTEDATDPHSKATERSQTLKTSLSKTLTKFYPLAGRLKDNALVESNDDGAKYTEGRANCSLSDILKKPEAIVLKELLPAPVESTEAATGYLLLVKATFFACGRLAIGVCVSHKIADAATLALFLKCWSGIARNLGQLECPAFFGSSIFPPMDFSIPAPPVEMMQQANCVTKRFLFGASEIARLKAKAASLAIPEPSRVEAVSALIWKSASQAARSNLGVSRQSMWSLAVNLRTRFVPPLPVNYAGNFVGYISPRMEEGDVELEGLVGRIRKEMEEFGENYVKKLQGEEAALAIIGFAKSFGKLAMNKETDFYNCSSWCKFGLYDATNFGWGKPIWLSIASLTFSNVVVLMDTRDAGGIEAWLTLSEDDMALVESNEELLEFASVNPGICFSIDGDV